MYETQTNPIKGIITLSLQKKKSVYSFLTSSCVRGPVADCKPHLSEPDLKLVWPSAKLLQAACSASIRASHIVTAAVMPSLVEQYNSRTQVNKDRSYS